jgi:hypothetical protein
MGEFSKNKYEGLGIFIYSDGRKVKCKIIFSMKEDGSIIKCMVKVHFLGQMDENILEMYK